MTSAKALLALAGLALAACSLADGQPCTNGTDCRTGYLCYWAGTEGCATQGQCKKVNVEATCPGALVSACGCDGNVATRSACTAFSNPIKDPDASACGDGGGD